MRRSPGKFLKGGKRSVDKLLTETRIVFINIAFKHHDSDA